MTAEVLAVTIGIGAEHEALAVQAAARMRRLANVEVRILSREDLVRCGVSDPNHLKFRLFDLVEAENILYFDADAFSLRPWDPRHWLDRPEWIAVRGFWFDPRVRRLGEIYGFGDQTFNGGLFLINRRHHEPVLHLARSIQPANNTFPGLINPDEIALSAALAVLRIPVYFLDRRFNWLQYGRGDLAGRAEPIIAHSCDPDLRRRYADPGETLFNAAQPAGQPRDDPNDSLSAGEILPDLSDAVYIYDRVGYDLRPLYFRSDGTIGEGGGEAERYHFGLPRDGRTQLVIGSVWDETCTLALSPDGVWRGRWSRHERMPIALTRHRAQVLIDLLTQAGRRAANLVGVEVGVHRGETSAILLRALPGLHLYMVDVWPDSSRADPLRGGGDNGPDDNASAPTIVRAARATAFAAHRRTLLPCDSVAASASTPDGLDFVFIDGDHTAGGVSADLRAWTPKLAGNGLLTGHDYGHPDYPGVQKAVEAFAAERGLDVQTHSDLVWQVPTTSPSARLRRTTDEPLGTPSPTPFAGRSAMPAWKYQAWNLAEAMAAFVADGLKTVSPRQYRARLDACDTCDRRRGNRCRECGCYVSIKARGRAFACPLGKWPAAERGAGAVSEG